MSTLSIDLAYTRHSDIGVALLHRDAHNRTRARALRIDLPDPPDVARLADWITCTADEHDVRCLCIDGPLGWRDPERAAAHGAVHSRVSERRLNAPGKTGAPGTCKPQLYLPFIAFSIALFERLTQQGWVLPDGTHRSAHDRLAPQRLITETFPTAAWRAFGLPPLPGKARAAKDPSILRAALATLHDTLGVELDGIATHDEVQAVIGGLAGLAWEAGDADQVRLEGLSPERLDGTWREGYIMIPAPSPPIRP